MIALPETGGVIDVVPERTMLPPLDAWIDCVPVAPGKAALRIDRVPPTAVALRLPKTVAAPETVNELDDVTWSVAELPRDRVAMEQVVSTVTV
jgi:hypothetical protein